MAGARLLFFSFFFLPRGCAAVKASVAAAQLLLTILELDLEFDLDLDLDLDLDNWQSMPQLSQSRATIEALVAVGGSAPRFAVSYDA